MSGWFRVLVRLNEEDDGETCAWSADPKVMACGDPATHMAVSDSSVHFLCAHHAMKRADEWKIAFP